MAKPISGFTHSECPSSLRESIHSLARLLAVLANGATPAAFLAAFSIARARTHFPEEFASQLSISKIPSVLFKSGTSEAPARD